MLIKNSLLRFGPYTRSGIALPNVNGLVVHYVGNPGTNAQQNIDYFNSIKDTGPHGSYHYIIDLDGTVYQLITEQECAWHAGPSDKTYDKTKALLHGLPNWRTLGISFCHPTDNGKPTVDTYRSLRHLVSLLSKRHSIPASRILRHHDCTGKECPKYYVDNPDKWSDFVDSIGRRDG